MAADENLKSMNLGNSGSPLFERTAQKSQSKSENSDRTPKCSFDCTTEIELPGLDSPNESKEIEDLDWKNPKNRGKFEKHRRLSDINAEVRQGLKIFQNFSKIFSKFFSGIFVKNSNFRPEKAQLRMKSQKSICLMKKITMWRILIGGMRRTAPNSKSTSDG